MKELIEKIEQKISELDQLREQLNELGKSKYNGLLGKFFKLSATEMIKVTGILYVDDTSVNVECLTIYGGKSNNGRLQFESYNDCYLTFDDIDEKKIIEVSREQFIDFLTESFEETKKVVLDIA